MNKIWSESSQDCIYYTFKRKDAKRVAKIQEKPFILEAMINTNFLFHQSIFLKSNQNKNYWLRNL